MFDDLNRRVLRGNLERNFPQLGTAEMERALKIAEVAFTGNIGNGQAAEIGAKAVLQERETGR